LRVISGKLKGKKLLALPGLTLRPTSDRVKEAIFDLLQKFPPGKGFWIFSPEPEPWGLKP